jgi:PEP-CTERM/exosortase A-associated glycosyltransferase
LETWALRHADAITTICEGLRRDIVARGIPGEKVTIVPNAVDTEKFSLGSVCNSALKQRLGPDGAWVLGFIGSFYAYEGLDVLLRALAKLLARGERVRALLVGGGPQEAKLKRLASELGIAKHVVFAGSVPHSEVERYYDVMDVLVYPRLSMRLTELVTPLKPLEAMARGRLLVASDVGGHRELIRPGQTGTLFKAGDVDALAEAVVNLLRTPERWAALKAAAKHYVETERTWKLSVARYAPVYGRLARVK